MRVAISLPAKTRCARVNSGRMLHFSLGLGRNVVVAVPLLQDGPGDGLVLQMEGIVVGVIVVDHITGEGVQLGQVVFRRGGQKGLLAEGLTVQDGHMVGLAPRADGLVLLHLLILLVEDVRHGVEVDLAHMILLPVEAVRSGLVDDLGVHLLGVHHDVVAALVVVLFVVGAVAGGGAGALGVISGVGGVAKAGVLTFVTQTLRESAAIAGMWRSRSRGFLRIIRLGGVRRLLRLLAPSDVGVPGHPE